MEDNIQQNIVVRNNLNMRKGKVGAQCAHAAMIFLAEKFTNRDDLSNVERQWLFGRFAKVVLRCDDDKDFYDMYNKARAAGLTVRMVTDSGLTEFGGKPTDTCFCIGPEYKSKLDPITGHLKPL